MSRPHDDFQDAGEEVIARVRQVRHRISARVGHDPYRLVAYYMERQERHRDRLVRAPEESGTDQSAA